jgi:prefoldin subunit 5
MMTSEDIIRIKRGPADLEEIIKKQRARIEELERDKEILTKEIDRLSEYSQNLERLLRQ